MTSDTVQDPFDILLNRKPLRTYENFRKNLNLSRSTTSTANNTLYAVAEWVEDQNKYLQTKIRSNEIAEPERISRNVPKNCKNVNSPNLLYNVRRSNRLKKRTARLISETENKENNPQRVPYFSDKNKDGNEKNKREIKEVFQDISSKLNIGINQNVIDENVDTAKNYVSVLLKTENPNIITRSRMKQCTKVAEQNENMKTKNLKAMRKNTNLETSQNVIHEDQPINTSQEINMESTVNRNISDSFNTLTCAKSLRTYVSLSPKRKNIAQESFKKTSNSRELVKGGSQEINVESTSNILVNQNLSDPFDSLTCAKSLRTYVSLSPKRKNIAEVSFKKTSNSGDLGKGAVDVSLQCSTPHREISTARIKLISDDNEKTHTKSNVKRKLIKEDKNIQTKNEESNILRHSERIMEKNRSQNEKSNIIKNSSIEIQLSRNHTPKMKNLKSTNTPTNIKDGDVNSAKSPFINKKSLRGYTTQKK